LPQRTAAGRLPEFIDEILLQILGERHALTAYDVAYLDLAKRLSLPLATLEGDLRKAGFAEKIELLGT
jgi:predicted nucleic acid-binding protein